MTKKRKIEILEKVKEEMKTGDHGGLCSCLGWLYFLGYMRKKECVWGVEIIYKYKPRITDNAYYYTAYSIPPRIRLLNRIIKDLKNGVKR